MGWKSTSEISEENSNTMGRETQGAGGGNLEKKIHLGRRHSKCQGPEVEPGPVPVRVRRPEEW